MARSIGNQDDRPYRCGPGTKVLTPRKNLLELTPAESGHLVRQLSVAMGAESRTTIPSRDGILR